MFRLEPDAEFRCRESSRPDPRHCEVRDVQRSYFLSTDGTAEVELSPAFGEMIAGGQADRPEPMGRADGRYWWIFRDRVYSTGDRLNRAGVSRLVERVDGQASLQVRRPAQSRVHRSSAMAMARSM